MPDDILISELSNAATIDDSAVFPLTQDNGGSPATFKASMSEIAGKVAEGTIFANLETTAKQIIPAINEAAQSGGGTSDIISTASGSIVTFTDGGDNIPVKSLVTEIVAVQSGTGTPSPSNDRPITGFDSIEIVVGVNLWDEDWEVGSINEQGNTPSTTRIRTKGYIKVIPSNTYYVKSPNNIWVWGYDENKNYKARIPDTSAISNRTITIPSDVYFIRFVVVDAYGTTYNNDISINYPSTDTAYHHSSTYTITLPETIYGGSLDVVGGNGSKTYERVALDSFTWNYDTNAGHERFYTDAQTAYKIPATVDDKANLKCEILQNASNMETFSHTVDNSISFGNTGRFYLYISGVTDTTALASIISGKYLVIELATPTTFTFTDANIPTLSGENNIYADCGDIAVEYFNENANQTSDLIDAKQEFCNYSSEEKVVGKWLDGSDLYEKTLYFNNKLLERADSTSELLHGVNNIGSVKFVYEAYTDFEGGQNWQPSNDILWINSWFNLHWYVGDTSIYIKATDFIAASTNRSYLMKIRYTKA